MVLILSPSGSSVPDDNVPSSDVCVPCRSASAWRRFDDLSPPAIGASPDPQC